MKKVFLTIISSAILLSIGFGVGYFYEILEEQSGCQEIKSSEQTLLNRINRYQVSCRELKNKGVLRVKKIGDDYILVIPNRRKDNYIVVGINDKNSPIVTWYGAGLKSAIKEICHK